MAAKFRKIDPRIWNDEEFQQLSPTDKLIALYIHYRAVQQTWTVRISNGCVPTHRHAIRVVSCRESVKQVCLGRFGNA